MSSCERSGILFADRNETPTSLSKIKSYRNQSGLLWINSAPNRALQNIITGVCSLRHRRSISRHNSTRFIFTSQTHPALQIPCVFLPVGIAPFSFVRHPNGRSHTNKSIDLSGNDFISIKQSDRRHFKDTEIGVGVASLIFVVVVAFRIITGYVFKAKLEHL